GTWRTTCGPAFPPSIGSWPAAGDRSPRPSRPRPPRSTAPAFTKPGPRWIAPNASVWCSRSAASRPRSSRSPATTPRCIGAGPRVNPLFVVPLLAYTLAATLWPGQVDGRRRGRALLFGEALFVIAALVLGKLLAPLARPSADGLWWGRVGLLATAYLYVSGRGIVLIRSVLELPTLQMRRDEDRTAGAIDVARGRAVGSLERALALTMVLLGE